MARSVAPATASLPPVDNTALATAIIALTAAISAMCPPLPSVMKPPVIDPFPSPSPFELSFRSGETSYNVASSPLDQIRDSTVAAFPFFAVSLRLQRRKMEHIHTTRHHHH